MKKRMVGLLSLIALAGEYLLVRFPLFPLHGMKDWPLVLLMTGILIISISGLAFGRKAFPVFTAIGYIAGFLFGYIFQSDYGPEWNRLNNMWKIWTCVYFVTILIGIIVEFSKKRETNDNNKISAI